jgi:hypothetical protein
MILGVCVTMMRVTSEVLCAMLRLALDCCSDSNCACSNSACSQAHLAVSERSTVHACAGGEPLRVHAVTCGCGNYS